MCLRAQFGLTVSDVLQSVSLQQAIGLTDICSCMGKLWLLVVFRLLCYLGVFFFSLTSYRWCWFAFVNLPTRTQTCLAVASAVQTSAFGNSSVLSGFYLVFSSKSATASICPIQKASRHFEHQASGVQSKDCPVLCCFCSFGFNQGCRKLSCK